jgi:hypothetical protein
MTTGKIVGLGIGALVLIIGIWIFSSYISYSNRDTSLRNQFTQKVSERTAFYDAMWKTFSQKAQIVVKADSGFANIVKIQMAGQADGPQVAMKWLQQTNPTASYSQIVDMYKDLSRTIESKRSEFFEEEKMLQDIKLQDDNAITLFPGSLFLSSRKPIDYKPITSTQTDNVIKTGKDDNTKVF